MSKKSANKRVKAGKKPVKKTAGKAVKSAPKKAAANGDKPGDKKRAVPAVPAPTPRKLPCFSIKKGKSLTITMVQGKTVTLTDDTVYVGNEFADTEPTPVAPGYDLVDGDVVYATYNYGTVDVVLQELIIEYVDSNGNVTCDDVVTYAPDSPIPGIDPDMNLDVNMSDNSPLEDFQQYYDDDNNPTYDLSDCNSSIGIRG